MKSILVIADDFSGAAEIAGIGHRFGLPTRLLREPFGDVVAGLTVVDTDTRAMSAEDAAARVSNTLGRINARRFDFVYKKIDSVLRGPVRDEFVAAMAAIAKGHGVLLPQNPSRGRTIRGGIYCVNGVPLEQTEFAHDPEYPALTSNARERAGLSDADANVLLPDADSLDDVRRVASSITDDTLPAGGADFFEAILHRAGFHPIESEPHTPLPPGRLFVCGTASRQRDQLLQAATARKFITCPISLNGSSQSTIDQVSIAMAAGSSAAIYIEHTGTKTNMAADQLQKRLIDVCHAVIARSPVRAMFAEGGSTAAGVCERLAWKNFAVQREWSPGVVQMTSIFPEGLIVFIVKPGSYAWPDEIWG